MRVYRLILDKKRGRQPAVYGELMHLPSPLHISARRGVIHFEFHEAGSVRNSGSGGIGKSAMEGQKAGLGRRWSLEIGDDQWQSAGSDATDEAAEEKGGFGEFHQFSFSMNMEDAIHFAPFTPIPVPPALP
jgi:hypothetical protein